MEPVSFKSIFTIEDVGGRVVPVPVRKLSPLAAIGSVFVQYKVRPDLA